jgi:hypothetical protein
MSRFQQRNPVKIKAFLVNRSASRGSSHALEAAAEVTNFINVAKNVGSITVNRVHLVSEIVQQYLLNLYTRRQSNVAREC